MKNIKALMVPLFIASVFALSLVSFRPDFTSGFDLGFQATKAQAAEANDASETYRMLNLFGDVFERVRQEYVEDVGDQELVEAAVNGMLTSLDPHSSYLNEESFKDMQVQTRGRFGGLGIEVTMENGLVKVISPIDDTPAFRAGLEPGDLVTHLDGEPVLGLNISEAVEKMRGPVGTDIELTIRREGADPFDVKITRDIIKIRSVRHEIHDKVGYLRVTTFNEETSMQLEKSVKEIQKELGNDLQGFVLDLRNNAGGLLEQAVAVSDAFLERGEVVSTRDRDMENVQRFSADRGDIGNGVPLVVIINGGSASASEIVAGALQDHRRAIVVGTLSFGKGSVQTIIPIPNHGAIRLTTARFYTPSGRSIQQKGIEPDIIVPPAKVDLLDDNGRRESDLRDALREEDRRSRGRSKNSDSSDDEEDKIIDYQLTRALDIIKGLHLYRQRASLN